MHLTGRAWVYGDDVNTDVIFPGKYTYTLTNVAEFARHALEDLDPDFARLVQPDDVIVAGRNFGCGSSREQAAVCIKLSGVRAIVARSFARIFFRNAINVGLPVVEVPDLDVADLTRIHVDVREGTVTDLTTGRTFSATRMPAVMAQILAAGGLQAYLKAGGDYSVKV